MHKSYVSNTRSNVHKHSRFVGKHVCLLIARSRKNTEFPLRGRKRYGTCVRLASSFVVFYAYDHAPSPPHTITTIASCHSQVEWDQTTVSVAKYLRQSHVIRLCRMQYTRGAKVSCFIYTRRHAVNNIRSISRKDKINSTQRSISFRLS